MSGWICARTIRARVLVHVYIPSPVHTHTTQYTQNTIDTVVRAKKKRALLRGIRMRCMRKKCMRAKNAYMQNACMRNACMRNACMRNVQKNVQMHACETNACMLAAGAQIRVPGRWQNAQERLWTSPSRTPARMHASPHTPGQQQIAPGLAPPSGAPDVTCQQAPFRAWPCVF